MATGGVSRERLNTVAWTLGGTGVGVKLLSRAVVATIEDVEGHLLLGSLRHECGAGRRHRLRSIETATASRFHITLKADVVSIAQDGRGRARPCTSSSSRKVH